MTTQYASVRAHIMDLLGQVQDLLEEAECDGRQLAELACFADVNDKFTALVETVDYYVD
jgi:DNA-binding ferritin-like protein (Dps family)